MALRLRMYHITSNNSSNTSNIIFKVFMESTSKSKVNLTKIIFEIVGFLVIY